MCLAVSAMKTIVSAPVTTVMMACIRMMRSKPITPPAMMSAATTSIATTLVASPPLHPSRAKTVDVASTAMTVSAVSQPTHSSQEIAEGMRLPRTPYAARDSTIVGAEPRLPAVAITPQSQKLKTMPIAPTMTAWMKEMPKPRTNAP